MWAREAVAHREAVGATPPGPEIVLQGRGTQDAFPALQHTSIERREKTPTPKMSALLRKRPVLLRANFVLTKDRKRPYYGHFCG